MSSLVEIMDALADQIETEIGGTASPAVEGLQVVGRLNTLPTPPSIDIYPGSPFQEKIGFGAGNNALFFTVRARVATPDHIGAQDVLLAMMDPNGSASVEQAVMSDKTLGTAVSNVASMETTDYGVFPEGDTAYLGCIWRVEVIP